MFLRTKALAARLAKPVVVFDLEHTGGAKGNRAITEFAAYVVFPDGRLQAYSSLVKPHAGAVFNPIVARITGITAQTVANSPRWVAVAERAVLPYQDALWVGFNSRASDMPVLLEECARHGLRWSAPGCHLDLMRVTPEKGALSKFVAMWVPDLDTEGAHRATKDALMTLWLTEALLGSLTDEEVDSAMQPLSKVARLPRPVEVLRAAEFEPNVEWQSPPSSVPALVAAGRFLGRALGGLVASFR